MHKFAPTNLLRVVVKDGPSFTMPFRIGNTAWATSKCFAPPRLTDVIRRVEKEAGLTGLTGKWVDDQTCLILSGNSPIALGRAVST